MIYVEKTGTYTISLLFAITLNMAYTYKSPVSSLHTLIFEIVLFYT